MRALDKAIRSEKEAVVKELIAFFEKRSSSAKERESGFRKVDSHDTERIDPRVKQILCANCCRPISITMLLDDDTLVCRCQISKLTFSTRWRFTTGSGIRSSCVRCWGNWLRRRRRLRRA